MLTFNDFEVDFMEELKKTLYGGESKNVCAYCKRKGCYMTVKQVKKKNCLKKECHHLDKKDHEWWIQRALLKQKRRNNVSTFA